MDFPGIMLIFTLFAIIMAVEGGGHKTRFYKHYCEANDEEPWSYHGATNGPRQWPQLFPMCNGNQQSPVSINTNNVAQDNNLSRLNFVGYDTPITQAEVLNNGHTVMFTPQDGVKRGITIEGRQFAFQQLHFHFGSVRKPGAEHTVNHIRYPVEAHFVHSSADNVTAVVGLLIDVRKRNNLAYGPIVEVLPQVRFKDETTDLQSALNLNDLLPENPASYYRYTGSLTTPTCNEGVIWSVLQAVQNIGYSQLNSFLRLYAVEEDEKSRECEMAPNYRPIQDLNDRVIYASQ
ncbi:carbonic anhydrase 9 [Caerostris darwini]|uniref:carbonic anhydrase n=1 Tax=Caerostris darwini TaxID=1538125 RepID=A0AAV4P943_9ARAC|nr:carbonic anhydrase 9 [Caerostris darwini]